MLRISGPFLGFLLLAGCGSNEFSVNAALEARPVQLDGEQIALDQSQVDCGVRDELWEITPLGDNRAVARLTKKGRDLQFSDDVQIGDPAVGLPYVQIHGSFPVRVIQVGSVHDVDQYTKTADARIAVRIDNSCFQMTPPTLMGIKHGQFDATTNPVFRFKMDNGWMVDQIVH